MQIIQRHEWGARHDDGFDDAPLPAREVWLHHSAGGQDSGPGVLRHLEDVGESRFGGGLSYTFVVDAAGDAYEGTSVDRQGSHTGGRNDISRAICWPGNYEHDRPTRAQIETTASLLAHGHEQGWWIAPELTGGHQQAPGAATACPGDNAMAVIDEINRLAAEPEEEIMASLDDLRTVLAEQRDEQAKLTWNWTMSGQPPYLSEDRAWVAQRETRDNTRKLLGMQAAMEALADALANQQQLDAETIKAAVRAAIEESVLEVDVSVTDGTSEEPT